jgi:hypothetical protein
VHQLQRGRKVLGLLLHADARLPDIRVRNEFAAKFLVKFSADAAIQKTLRSSLTNRLGAEEFPRLLRLEDVRRSSA